MMVILGILLYIAIGIIIGLLFVMAGIVSGWKLDGWQVVLLLIIWPIGVWFLK